MFTELAFISSVLQLLASACVAFKQLCLLPNRLKPLILIYVQASLYCFNTLILINDAPKKKKATQQPKDQTGLMRCIRIVRALFH